MRRTLLLVVLVALSGAVGLSRAPELAAQSPAPRIGAIHFTTVGDWQSGLLEHLLISRNDDGELRLAENQPAGVFTSGLTQTEFPFNALAAVWRAELPQATSLKLEVRGGPAADQLGDWQTFAASDARSQSDDGALTIESVQIFPNDSQFLQFRATFNTTIANASPVLSEMTLKYISSTVGAARPDGLTRVPAPYGQPTLTPAPMIIQRRDWAAAPSGQIARQSPRGIIVHQIGADNLAEPLPFLRALAAFDTQVLGWDDVPFHFIIDKDGTVYEGHAGGPSAAVARLSGGDMVVHVALIGASAPPTPQRDALTGLLAWLGEAYRIAPLDQHTFTPSGGAPVARPNIAAHAEVVPEAADPSQDLRTLMGTLRQESDKATCARAGTLPKAMCRTTSSGCRC